MRKLAPLFALTTIAAFMAGPAAAMGDTSKSSDAARTTDNVTGSPTVDANTANPQGTSYSDKSNASSGTNSRMGDSARMKTPYAGTGVMDDDKTLSGKAKAERMRRHRATVATVGDSTAMDRTAIETSNGAAANSTTGTSGGGR
ncbi:MAG: hypothetical protein ACXWGT_03380 [Usitatibacter sp.]